MVQIEIYDLKPLMRFIEFEKVLEIKKFSFNY